MDKITKKEQGNKLYKQQKFRPAIDCYKQYVLEDHDDNKAAYLNMSLCLFKIDNWKGCAEACLNAIKLDSNYTKAHYRLALAYNKIDYHYGVVVYGSLFCKATPDKDKEKPEIEAMIEKHKKCLYGPTKEKVAPQFTEILDIGHRNEPKPKDVIYDDDPQRIKQWKEVERTFANNREDRKPAEEKALAFLCSLQDETLRIFYEKKYFKFKLKYSLIFLTEPEKRQRSEREFKRKILLEQLAKLPKEERQEKRKQIPNYLQKIPEPQISKENPEPQLYDGPIFTKSVATKSRDDKKTVKAKTANWKTFNQTLNYQPPLLIRNTISSIPMDPSFFDEFDAKFASSKTIEQIYQQFFAEPLKKCDDIFDGFKSLLWELLKSNQLSLNHKKNLLVMISEKFEKFKLIKLGMSEDQRFELTEELTKWDLRELIPLYVKK